MDDSVKYLIHANIIADGVVEHSDVVGAVFGQTEGLLGDELDIRDLQESSKLGRIDVEVQTDNGRSYGRLTIGSNLDRVETAILAAGLETIDRIGPCKADLEVDRIEDTRQAKRREIVERAKELLSNFEESSLTSQKIIEEVRDSVRTETISEYKGLPAGPRVSDGDAIILVEGRSDVRQLLEFGIKNAIAIEGTNIPTPIIELTQERTTTAFLDGDRGGDLILRELSQVADVDYVARAPDGKSVEDLSREDITTALQQKAPVDIALSNIESDDSPVRMQLSENIEEPNPDAVEDSSEQAGITETNTTENTEDRPATLLDHLSEVEGTQSTRFLTDDLTIITEVPADETFETLTEIQPVPDYIIIDGTVTQRILDVASQRGIQDIIAEARGEFTKQPTSVRIRTFNELQHRSKSSKPNE
ncbi:MAG: DNA primase DnaG [Halobacteriaceae archaeon]